MTALARLLTPLRDAAWLDAARAAAWLRILATLTALAVAAWILASPRGLDPTGKPLGTDFISFWSASRLLLDGASPASVYDPSLHAGAEQQAFPGTDVGYSPFAYPPIFLLVCLPLGLAPYFASLAAWMAASGYGYWRVARAWLGASAGAALPVLAFPAVLINLGHGQNGFLSAALFGAGALALGRAPWLAGACFGALAFKPQLGLLIPVVLLAARQWRAIAGAALSAGALAAAATLAFGAPAWRGFLGAAPLVRAMLEDGLLDPGKFQSLFAALRLWGAPVGAAYAAQALLALTVAAALAWLAWRRPQARGLGPALIAGSLLVSPYLMDYDLTLAAIPLAWLFAEGRRDGFRPWEKIVLLAAYVLPLVSRSAAMNLGLPLGPPVLAALLVAALSRAWWADEAHLAASRAPKSPLNVAA